MAESNAASVTASLMLHGRVAIVTGGAGGIGSAVSKHLASLGARVAVAYVGDPEPAQNLVASINAAHAADGPPPRAIAVETDVSDAAQVRALFEAAAAAFGGQLHILVTAAGVLDTAYPPLAETTEESYDATFGVNARGTFLCLREAANRLARDGCGRIVTFSSSGVGSLRPGYTAYAASKAAVETMTRILAKELCAARGSPPTRWRRGPRPRPCSTTARRRRRRHGTLRRRRWGGSACPRTSRR